MNFSDRGQNAVEDFFEPSKSGKPSSPASTGPKQRIPLGSALAALGREAGLTDADVDALQAVKHPPAEPMSFE